VHFLDVWLTLPPLALARLAAPVALLVIAIFMPGRIVARLTAIGVAVALPFLPELGAPPAVTAGWMMLWLGVGWQAGLPPAGSPRSGARLHGLESGTIGVLLGPALLVLMVAAVARLDVDAETARRASYGVLLVCLGLVHLMLRRHIVRAATAFASMGLGLQALHGAARAPAAAGYGPGAGAPLLACALAVALAVRIGRMRDLVPGSPWVNDAHDLHD